MKTIISAGIVALSALCAGPAFGQNLNGAGATFPAPIYQKWFQEYKTAHSSVQINYQPIGSGGGISAMTEGTVDFGASDMPMTDEQIGKLKVRPLHFPTVLGADVITYNLPGVSGALKFSGDTIANIFLGKIAKWNDPKIAADNPGVKLPSTDIVVAHRSDGSGTTFVFCDYLSKVSPEWKSKVGASTSVTWPVGLGGAKNDGVAGIVKQTEGAIGYVELVFAVQNKMAFADVKNAAGKFVTPSFASVTAAAQASKDLAADFRGSITNAPGAGSYPISSYTWLLIPSQIQDAAKKKAITDFLGWMLTTGQKDAEPLSYAPLPAAVVAKEKQQIAAIK
jgi:phosphate transport system substrate-binding protein